MDSKGSVLIGFESSCRLKNVPSKRQIQPVNPQVVASVVVSNQRLLAPRELASYLNVSLPTLKRLYLKGELPSIRVGDQVRFEPAEVVAALKLKCRGK